MIDANKPMGVLEIVKFSWSQALKGLVEKKMGTLGPLVAYILACMALGAIVGPLVGLLSTPAPTPTGAGMASHHLPASAHLLITSTSLLLSAYFLPVLLIRCYALMKQDAIMAQQAWRRAGQCYWRVLAYHILLMVFMLFFLIVTGFLAKLGALGVLLMGLITIIFYLAILPWVNIALPSMIFDNLSAIRVFTLLMPAAKLWAVTFGAVFITFILPLLAILGLGFLLHSLPVLGLFLLVVCFVLFFVICIPLIMNLNLAIYHNFKLKVQNRTME